MAYPLDPATCRLTSGFGMRAGVLHRGMDFAAALGTPIYAVADGTVVESRSGVSGFGCWVWIRHTINGERVDSISGHMYPADLLVTAGETVRRGQLIARVGNNGQSTGPHCHFEVWAGGRLGGSTVDPAPWLTS